MQTHSPQFFEACHGFEFLWATQLAVADFYNPYSSFHYLLACAICSKRRMCDGIRREKIYSIA